MHRFFRFKTNSRAKTLNFKMERLRFLKNLRSLNLRGNSIEDGDKNFRLYIAGLLPGLKYYGICMYFFFGVFVSINWCPQNIFTSLRRNEMKEGIFTGSLFGMNLFEQF